jgi:predicted nucleic acid-binding protein
VALTVVDSGVLIALLDENDPHHPSSKRTLIHLQNKNATLAVSTVSLTEILVYPMRRGAEAVRKVFSALDRLSIIFLDITPRVAESAARLRAKNSQLRTPDALVIATAQSFKATALLTTDTKLTRLTSRSLKIKSV